MEETMLMPRRVCIPTVLNNVPYCDHERDICHECCQLPWDALATRRFRLPESGQPEYPASLPLLTPDAHLRHLIGKRWLDMQETLFSPSHPLRTSSVVLPASASDTPDLLHPRLLALFRHLHIIASSRRYFFATHANILLNDYDTFEHAAVLYENLLTDVQKCAANLYAKDMRTWRSKASIITTFGYFLGLETYRTFWRIMESTMQAFVSYLENFDEALDCQVVMEDKAKPCLLRCLAHVFWSLQHAQYQLNELRQQQHVDFLHKGSFPFYPFRDVEALEAGLDVHVLVTKMSMASILNFPQFSSLLSAFSQASEYAEQMLDVNVEIMAAIDELSTRFRVMEWLIVAAAMVTTTAEIKDAIVTFKFDPQMEGATCISQDLKDAHERAPLPSQNLSLLHGLLIEAAKTRRKNIHRFQHRKEVAKKKKKQQQASIVQADIAEDRVVPKAVHADPELYWEVGNARLEKYVPPLVREKIKTRKQGDGADSEASNEGSQQSTPKSVHDESEISLRVYRPVKEGDLKTRDILWRKAKGILKWRNFVHFLNQLGCKVMSMDGSIKKVVDMVTGRSALLHRPHTGEDCRPDQRDSYRVHLEDWLQIQYSDVVPAEEMNASQSPAADLV